MSKVIPITALILSVSACSQEDGRICADAPLAISSAEQCVHRHAYLMADAEGSISDIAKAVTQKCNDFVLKQSMDMAAKNNGDADKLLIWYEAETLKDAGQRVTEARAGQCQKPD